MSYKSILEMSRRHFRRATMNRRQKELVVGVACGLLAGLASPTFAQREPTELINQQHCMFCHTVDAPFLAPSFHQIAERYRDKPHAADMLEEKLRRGGKAHWGDTPMPPPADRGGPLSAQDARTLVDWVLSQ